MIDDSDTAEAAMKASDAMISDYSSLVMQYNFTGKPSYLLTGKSENRKDCVFVIIFQTISEKMERIFLIFKYGIGWH